MTEPAYERIRDELRRRIESGELAPGAKLPTHSALAAHYGVSVQPVRQALLLLEQVDRLIVSYQGKGVFVADRAGDFRP
ncbi:winged helix-turn-helix domain-containing protein [Planosporangium sp. 12N6]|uniref:winged helix-turn-helix domain-containing protein n=1 Tax=Planosporangium spinosum TaxID=3402278 RepID=UPI003CE84ECF